VASGCRFCSLLRRGTSRTLGLDTRWVDLDKSSESISLSAAWGILVCFIIDCHSLGSPAGHHSSINHLTVQIFVLFSRIPPSTTFLLIPLGRDLYVDGTRQPLVHGELVVVP
jgi:hypothetical protein